MQQLIMKNPYNAYREQGVMTASPVELIIMLYDGCKRNLLQAKRAMTSKSDPSVSHRHLMKAQNIISELLGSLDMSFSLSRDLMALYEFLLHSLTEINAEKNAEAIDPLIEILDELRNTWEQVNQMQKGKLYLAENLKEE